MKTILLNFDHFIKEVKTMIRMNLLTNSLTVLSTGLIFFILAMVISGWWVSNQVVEVIQGEAEISVYPYEKIVDNPQDVQKMLEKIQDIKGVQAVSLVDKDEAYHRMEEILGKEAGILNNFEENPFNPFLELSIDLEQMDPVVEKLNHIEGIEYVRDNREVLDRLRSIAGVMKYVGILILAAVGISTLVVISHIIRLGISNNRDQIETLRLLGAPETFIGFPFLLEGLLLTLGGGLLATALAALALQCLYTQMAGPLPFLPLPPYKEIISHLAITVISLSVLLGIIGSLLGLLSKKQQSVSKTRYYLKK